VGVQCASRARRRRTGTTLLKVVYGWGLRAREAIMLDTVDLFRNPKGTGVR
jgi:hypothetical protein